MTFFDDILKKSGVFLSKDDETSNVLTQEQSLVIRDIKNVLLNSTEEENIRNFVSDLKVYFKNRSNFRLGLLPSVLKKTDEESTISLVRILLNIDELQSEMIQILLEEITRCSSENNEEDVVFLKMCLNSLRYLPYIKDSVRVTKRILDILEISTFESRLEILHLIPDIIPDSQCDVIAKQLCKLLGDSSELTAAIIDCLNCLNLSSETKFEIEISLTERLNDFNAISNFPVLYEFLIKNNSKQSLNIILGQCRDALSEILLSEDCESEKVIIFNKLNNSMFIKNVYEGYMQFLSKVKEDKPIDILLLVILHSAVKNKKQRIEILFKKKVRLGLKINVLENFYRKYLTKSFMKEYLNSLIDLASTLLKDNEADFAVTMYKSTFEHVKDDVQRQEVVHNLIALTGFWDVKHISRILKVLKTLSEDKEKMKRFATQLMLLLDKLDAYELSDVKTIFDILCSLVCKDDNLSGIKNELHILIRKQLSTSKVALNQCGIIGAIVMVKNILLTEENQSEFLDDSDSISSGDLSANAQESIKLLNLAENTCGKSTYLIGLFYDQLANVIANNELDRFFLKWLFRKITEDFQDKYVSENVPLDNTNLEYSPLYSLNTTEETNADIYINIAELTAKKKISILAPFFRLVRLVHFKENNGNLSTIDALLGCGVILPKIENLETYSMEELREIADSLYHCVNWFREVISAFVTQPQKKIRRKVLHRLRDLVEVENLLEETMSHIPEHKLPVSCFHSSDTTTTFQVPTKNVKRPRKKQKLNETASTSLNETNSKKPKKSPIKMSYNFRCLDTDVMILLKYPLKLNSGELEVCTQTQQTTIDVSSFNFLLKDLGSKLEILTKNSKDLSLMNIATVNPHDLITDSVKLLPNIHNKFQVISRRLKTVLEEADFVYDHHSLFTETTNELKLTFCSVLICLNLIFNWNGFKNPKNLKLLRDCLKALKSSVDSSQLTSTNQLSKDLVLDFSAYTEQCLNLPSAVNLTNVLRSLCGINSNNSELKKKVAQASSKLLSRSWFDSNGQLEKGKEHFENIDVLIRAYLDGANVKTLGGLISTLQDQVEMLKLKEDNLDMLKSINKMNFHVLYRNFCINLQERVKIEIQSLTNAEHLNLWKSTSISLQGLMTILKLQETRSNLIHFLKKSVGILKLFLSHGIPIMEIVLRSKTDQVVEILKTLQITTRFLHHLCCHSKVTKDSALIAHVPQFRLTLETFIFRVKAMLVANDCSAAFWMGNLRNRDLHGEDILSQSSVTTDENCGDNNEEEELPPDESEDEVVTDVEESNQDSASEVFD